MEKSSDSILLFGGRSEERLVSVASAQNIETHFPFTNRWFIGPDGKVFEISSAELRSHENPFEVLFKPRGSQIASSISELIVRIKSQSIFLALHGTEGEDGSLQRELESAGVAFTGSGSESSHNCFDKIKAKKIVTAAGLPVAPQLEFKKSALASNFRQTLEGFFKEHGKIAIKPSESGSSIGLHIIDRAQALAAVIDQLQTSHYDSYLAEKFITGRELTVGVISENSQGPSQIKALPASEVILMDGHNFDYKGKYLGHGTREITPASLTPVELKSVQTLALDAHRRLGCFGYTRTDMILSDDGPVFLETNTLPGLSKASFVPQQLAIARISIGDFVGRQLELACERKKSAQAK